MPTLRRFVDVDVLTESLARVALLYERFDRIAVAFSGGKDSLAVLHLAKQIAEKTGRLPVDAYFLDEEFIHQEVVDFVLDMRAEPWLNLRWLCIPLKSTRYIGGKVIPYIQWDWSREPIRERPAFALSAADIGLPDHHATDQHEAEIYLERVISPVGSLCILTGIRASESLRRYRAVANKPREPFVTNPVTKRMCRARPIYDWNVPDVFKFFHDFGIRYCPVYDAQLWAGANYRVCSALVTESAKRFDRLSRYDPLLAERALQAFPDMNAQRIYCNDFKANHDEIIARWGATYDTVREYIRLHLPTEMQELALKRVAQSERSGRSRPVSYSPDYILKNILLDGGERNILPQSYSDAEGTKRRLARNAAKKKRPG